MEESRSLASPWRLLSLSFFHFGKRKKIKTEHGGTTDIDVTGPPAELLSCPVVQNSVCPPSRSLAHVLISRAAAASLLSRREKALCTITFVSSPPPRRPSAAPSVMQCKQATPPSSTACPPLIFPRRHNRISGPPSVPANVASLPHLSPTTTTTTTSTTSPRGCIFVSADPWCLTGMSERGAAVTEAGQSGCGH